MLLGTDIVDIERMRLSLENDRFLLRIFTKEERRYLEEKKDPVSSAAGMFAAKEAFAKAVGTGFRGFMPGDVGVVHAENGRPYFVLSNGAAAAAKGHHFTVSISHSDTAAVAVVLGEEEKK